MWAMPLLRNGSYRRQPTRQPSQERWRSGPPPSTRGESDELQRDLGNLNAASNITVTMASGYPVLKCFTSTGVTCVSGMSGRPSANGIQVKQQATVPTFFGNAIGVRFAEPLGDGHRRCQRRQGHADGRDDHRRYDSNQ